MPTGTHSNPLFKALQSKAIPCHPPHGHVHVSRCMFTFLQRYASKEHFCSPKVLAVSGLLWVGMEGGAYDGAVSQRVRG